MTRKHGGAGETPLGERQTPQRRLVEDVVRMAEGPLTVQEIHDRATREMPGLGIATVYRTLKLMLAGERAETVILPEGGVRYERGGIGHHHHFHCRSCDRVFDLESCPLPPGPRIREGYVVEDHELTLYGLCPACARADPGREGERGGSGV